MKGSRPEQAFLTRDNDLSKTEETVATIDAMVDGLNDHDIDNMGRFFSETFRWMGNAGCGVKNGLREFQENWQRPFQAAFSEKVCIDEARLAQGEWCAAFGRQEAVHSGEFMGIAPTGKRVEIRYMDFWKVVDGKIVDNWVMVDFPSVMQQLGVDPITGLDITALVTDNINNATLQGLEVDLNYLVGESGRLDISGALLDTEIKKNDDYTEFWFCDERATTAFPCDPNASASGLELPFAPDWTLTVAYGHDFYLPGGGRITPWVQVHWESEAWMTSDNFDAIEQYSSARPSFSTVNATVGYYAEDDKWSLELFCSNCTDEWIRTFVIADSSGAFGGYRAPRFAGIRGQFNF